LAMSVEEKGRAEWLTEASLLLAVLFLGTNPVAVKVAVSEVPPLPFVAMRFTLAGLLLLCLVLLLRLERPGRRDVLSMAGVGLIGVGMNNAAFTLGVSMTTASDTALIYAAVPIWGILLGLALGLERPVRKTHRMPLRTSLESRQGLPRSSARRTGAGISGSSNSHCSLVRSMLLLISNNCTRSLLASLLEICDLWRPRRAMGGWCRGRVA
jgi:hypothetical protein